MVWRFIGICYRRLRDRKLVDPGIRVADMDLESKESHAKGDSFCSQKEMFCRALCFVEVLDFAYSVYELRSIRRAKRLMIDM
jgi:hypothetical protein